jgi:uncharacterized protein (DUF1330 family)
MRKNAAMPAYVVSRLSIKDPERMREYSTRSGAMAKSYGGTYLARAEQVEALDGSFEHDRLVVMYFPDLDRVREFWASPEYQELRKIRLEASDGDVWLIPVEQI